MTSNRVERRDFLVGGGAAVAACACAGLGASGCKTTNMAAKPVAAKAAEAGRIAIGSASDLAVGGQLKVTAPGLDDTVLVARVSASDVRAVSISCTHFGSEVAYVEGQKNFRCDSHGSEFDLVGKVTVGPASDALTRYEVVEEEGQLLLVLPTSS